MRSKIHAKKPLWLVLAAGVVTGCNVEVNVNLVGDPEDGDRPAAAPSSPAPASPERLRVPEPPVAVPSPRDVSVRDALWRPWLHEEARDGEAAPCEEMAGHDVAPRVTDGAAAARNMEELYPPLLREAGIGGTVRVCLLVGAEGQVLDAVVIETSGYPALDDAAERAAYRIDFAPAMRGEDAVPARLVLPLTFRTR